MQVSQLKPDLLRRYLLKYLKHIIRVACMLVTDHCEHCGYQISPVADTIFHKSPTPLTIWFHVIYLMSQTRGVIYAKQIQRETGVTYKRAWRRYKQVRSMLDEPHRIFTGNVELDKSYLGGKGQEIRAVLKLAVRRFA